MSVQAMTWVLEHSQTRGTTRMVMMAIANHVDASGEGWCYRREVLRAANCSLDTYHRSAQRAVELGELEVHVGAGGSRSPGRSPRDDQRPNLFAFPRMQTQTADPAYPRGTDPADQGGTDPADPPGSQTADPAPPSIRKEPSLNRQGTVTLSAIEFCSDDPASGGTRPPDGGDEDDDDDDDPERPLHMVRACALVADRRYRLMDRGSVSRPVAWKRHVAAQAESECREVPGWQEMTAEEIADYVEPPPPRTQPAAFGEGPPSPWDEPEVGPSGALVVRPKRG